jgi:hypothetical protein
MDTWREDQLTGFPQIAESLTTFITGRNVLPEKWTGLLTSVTDGISNDLACPTTYHGPNPTFSPTSLRKPVF